MSVNIQEETDRPKWTLQSTTSRADLVKLQPDFLEQHHPYSTNAWCEAILFALTDIDTKAGTYVGGLELRVFWKLSPHDEAQYEIAAKAGKTA